MTNVLDTYMMRLGQFQFAVSTACFERLNTSATYRWDSQQAPTNNRPPRLQYNGPGERTMAIDGTIFPQIVKGGLGQLDKMRAQAEQGKAFTLCYVETTGGRGGVGRILGKWCITQIDETRTLFLPDGNPREINFSMQLKAY